MNTYCELCGSVEHENDTVDVCKEITRLRAEISELRKRMGEAVECLQKIQGDKLTMQQVWGLAMEAEYTLTLGLPALASPPSPAPVEKMPMVVKVNPKACVKCGCGPSAHWADNDGPLQGEYCHSCGQCADYVPPAAVESKPKEESK